MTQKPPKLSPAQLDLLRSMQRAEADDPPGRVLGFGYKSVFPLQRYGYIAGQFNMRAQAHFRITDAGRAALAAIEAKEDRAELAVLNAQEDHKC